MGRLWQLSAPLAFLQICLPPATAQPQAEHLDVSQHGAGWSTAFFSGSNGFLVPQESEFLLRFDPKDFSIVEALDVGTGFVAGFANGDSGFLLHASDEVLRFNLAGTMQIQQRLSVGGQPGTFVGAATDGSHGYAVSSFGKVLSFGLSDLSLGKELDVTLISPWAILAALDSPFRGALADGDYLYLLPGDFSILMRVPMATLAPSDVEVVNVGMEGFCGGFAADGYLYLVPKDDSTLVRVPLQNFVAGAAERLVLPNGGFCGGFAADGFGYLASEEGTEAAVIRLADFSFVVSTNLGAVYRGGFAHEGQGYLAPAASQIMKVTLSATLDLGEVGFRGGFAGAGYAWLVPGLSKTLTRVSLRDFSVTATKDLASKVSSGRETLLFDGFSSGDYGFLLPEDLKKVLIFNMKDLDEEILELSVPQKSWGSFTDGKHGYVVPFQVVGAGSPLTLARFDLSMPRDTAGNLVPVESLTLVEAGNFCGGFAEGDHGYLVNFGKSKVVRLTLSKFANGGDVETLDVGLNGFIGGFSDGSYGYLTPSGGSGRQVSVAIRFSLEGFPGTSSVEQLDLAQHDSELKGLIGGFQDGTYGYMGTNHEAGKVAVFSLDDFSYVRTLSAGKGALFRAFSHNGYGYFVPGGGRWGTGAFDDAIHGNLFRIALATGPVTTTTTETTSTESTSTTTTTTSSTSSQSTTSSSVSSTSSSSSSSVSSSTTVTSSSSSSSSSSASSTSSTSRTSSSTTSGSSTSSSSMTSSSSSSSSSSSRSSSSTSSVSSSSSSSSSSTRTSSSTTSRSSTTSSSSSATTSSTSSVSSTSTSSSTSISSTSTSSHTSPTTSRTSTTTSRSSTTSSYTGTATISSSTWTSTTVTSTLPTSITSSSQDPSSSGAPERRQQPTTSRTSTWTFEATMASVEADKEALLASTTTSTTMPMAAVAGAVEAAMLKSVAALGNDTRAVVATEEGTMTLVSADKLLEELGNAPSALQASESGGGAAITKSLLRSLPPGSVLAMLESGSSELKEDAFADVKGGQLAAPSMAISIVDGEGQRVTELAEPLLFRLPDGPPGGQSEARCVYFDTVNGEWSDKGVRRVTDARVAAAGQKPGGVWCETDHLSIFAAILNAVLGCTNLELLTPDAMSALVEHEGWWRARPVVLWFVATGALLACLLLGTFWELWALRLGRTHEEGKNVKICRALLKLGPQLLKHKYAAFLVFGREIYRNFRSGRDKLRKPTLTMAIQRCFAVRTGVSTACVAQHCWKGGAWLHSTASLPHTVLCHKLEFHSGGAEEVIEHELRGRRCVDVLKRYVIAFLAGHPLLDAMRLGASSMSVRKRMSLQLAAFMGVLATNGLIFNFSGAQRSWEADAECPISPTSDLFILVATFVSLLLNVLPNTFLADVARQVHGRPSWNCLFWLLCLGYFGFCTLLVLVALANLNPKDQKKWHRSMEWSLTIKFLGMPAAQALRNNLMLEHFLHEDSKSKHIEQTMGLKSEHEGHSLRNDELGQVAGMADRSVSAGELMNFASLLGDQLMPNYSAECSTSLDVAPAAVRFFTPSVEDMFLDVEVMEVKGLRTSKKLRCAVMHLGAATQGERPRLMVEESPAFAANAAWHFQTRMNAVHSDHAFGFTVSEGGTVLGSAHWPVDELLDNGCLQQRALQLHPADRHFGAKNSFKVPPRCSSREFGVTASGGKEGLAISQATLVVKVTMAPGYLKAVARHELQNLGTPLHPSEVRKEASEHRAAEFLKFTEEEDDDETAMSGWDAVPRKAQDKGVLPAERLVVHSLRGNFLDLVAAVLADALNGEEDFATVRKMLHGGDFHGASDMLRAAGGAERRYWINIFALEVDKGMLWHEDYLTALPWLMRGLRRDCCHRMIAEYKARKTPTCGLPSQLLIVDKDFQLLRDRSCAAEAMLGQSLSFAQKLILHPEHLEGPKVGTCLREVCLPVEEDNFLPWAEPYTRDRGAVYLLLAGLAVTAAREQKASETALQDMKLQDVAAVTAAFAATRSSASRSAGGDGAEDEALEDLDIALDD